MKKGVVVTIGIVSAVLALLLVMLTTPRIVGPLGVLAFFVLVYIATVSLVYLTFRSAVGMVRKILTKGRWLMRAEGVSNMKLYYYSSVLGLAPVILMGMRSVGEIGVGEILLLVIFEVLAIFYISRRF